MKKFIRIITMAITAALMCTLLTACSSFTCDKCGEKCTGDAYYGDLKATTTVCRDCAQRFWAPLPVDNYKR